MKGQENVVGDFILFCWTEGQAGDGPHENCQSEGGAKEGAARKCGRGRQRSMGDQTS